MAIAEDIKSIFSYLFSKQLINNELLLKLQDEKYCSEQFSSGKYPVLLKRNNSIPHQEQRTYGSKQARYYHPDNFIIRQKGEEFFFTSQIYEEQRSKYYNWVTTHFNINPDEMVISIGAELRNQFKKYLDSKKGQDILDEPAFFFKEARRCLEEFKSFDISSELLEEIIKNFSENKNRHREYINKLNPDEISRILINLIEKLVAHIDYHAANKNFWNKTNRIIASSQVRQNHWIEEFLNYKLNSCELEAINSPSIKNAIILLEKPQEGLPVLSEKDRTAFCTNVMGVEYNADKFVNDFKRFFVDFKIPISNFDNLTTYLSNFICDESIKPIWKSRKEKPMSNEENNNVFQRLHRPVNKILHGPPGTGKTYNSKKVAVELITGSSEESRFLELYSNFQSKGQIMFVTFHPNFGYENFVEGIFPDTSSGGSLSYVLKDGVFKAIVAKALKELIRPIEHFEGIAPFDEAYQKFLDHIEEQGGAIDFTTLTHEKPYSVSESETGGITITISTGKVFHCSEKKLKSLYEELSMRGISNPERLDIVDNRSLRAYTAGILRRIFELSKNVDQGSLNDSFDPFVLLKTGKYTFNPNPKKFVLIIDEINRGNIPAILGELISLIEDSKRLAAGNEENTIVTLPLSHQSFAVPSNLYILGTMNTSDRSVEALDVALRRRFSFEYLPPQFNDLDVVDNIDLSLMLSSMNKRILALKGKDYLIGHSYFMDITSKEEVIEVFHSKIIPLLEEYFFGQLHLIGIILDKSFVRHSFTYEDLRMLRLSDHVEVQDTVEISDSLEWKFEKIYG